MRHTQCQTCDSFLSNCGCRPSDKPRILPTEDIGAFVHMVEWRSSTLGEWLCNRFFVGAGPSTSNDARENQIQATLLVTLATGQKVCALAPQFNDKLVGSRIAFRWDIGWELGEITAVYNHPIIIKKKRKRNTPECANVEVKFPSERHARDILLKPDRYVGKDSTDVSSWCVYSE